jgi:sugar phosphate isomerase/epimerase
MAPVLSKVLWEWNVTNHLFEQQIEGAVAGCYDILTVPVRRFRAEVARGLSAQSMLAIARENGVRLDFLDGMSSWAPTRFPDDADPFVRAALDFSADEALDICERLELKNIVAIGGFSPGKFDLGQLIDAFGDFCDRASRHGIWVDLEAMPMLGIPTLADAYAIVGGANRPNSGLLFDTWHFMRGHPDMELLSSLPRGMIRNVQLADAAREVQGSLWEDATLHRRFPGEGDFPMVEMLQIINETQNISSFGPEILSTEIHAMSAEEAGRRSARSTEAVMRRAGFDVAAIETR